MPVSAVGTVVASVVVPGGEGNVAEVGMVGQMRVERRVGRLRSSGRLVDVVGFKFSPLPDSGGEERWERVKA